MKLQFPNIKENRVTDVRKLRWYAVCLTSTQEHGINLPLAKAITDFTLSGRWNVGDGYEKDTLEEMLGKSDEPVK